MINTSDCGEEMEETIGRIRKAIISFGFVHCVEGGGGGVYFRGLVKDIVIIIFVIIFVLMTMWSTSLCRVSDQMKALANVEDQ